MPMPRQTHTCVELEISPEAYREIHTKLEAAGYHHVFHEGAMDMTGIALVQGDAADYPEESTHG